jgi:23S rRNA (uracil1939-C5)-methyltransferase
VWFVAGALPGEEVEAEPVRRRAGIVEADVRTVLRGSPWRENRPCPVALECGGCDLDHVMIESRAAALREVAAGALRHAPPVLTELVGAASVVVSPPRWRLRARLHWNAGRRLLGFFGSRTRTVVSIDPCRVVSERLLDRLPELTRRLADARLPDGELHWLEDLDGKAAVAGWGGGGDQPLPDVDGIEGFHPLDSEGATSPGGWGASTVVMQLPTPLLVPVGAFFQGNRHLVPRLWTRVSERVRLSGQAEVVDLYGGVGFLAAAAGAGGAARVTVVESAAVAAEAARGNLPAARVIHASAESFLDQPSSPDCLAVIDPPRVGLSSRALSGLLQWGPRHLLLLGCDVARFGRDVGRLLAGGYHIDLLELWDMFGGSHHVEVLASLSR